MAIKDRNFEATAKVTSKRLATLFKSRNMKAYKVAEELGISAGTIYNWIHGSRIPQLSVLIQLAKIYNVSVDWILGLSDKPYLDDNALENKVDYIDLAEADTFRILYNKKPISEDLSNAANGLLQSIKEIASGSADNPVDHIDSDNSTEDPTESSEKNTN